MARFPSWENMYLGVPLPVVCLAGVVPGLLLLIGGLTNTALTSRMFMAGLAGMVFGFCLGAAFACTVIRMLEHRKPGLLIHVAIAANIICIMLIILLKDQILQLPDG